MIALFANNLFIGQSKRGGSPSFFSSPSPLKERGIQGVR
jgi:hypothetical protein